VRNAALVLGSRRAREAVPALTARLDDAAEDPVIRASAAWALGQIDTAEARAALARNHERCESGQARVTECPAGPPVRFTTRRADSVQSDDD
jgi:HEAT repeat protein